MQQYKDITLNAIGAITGTISLVSVNDVLQVITALATLALFALSLVRAVIQTVDIIKKHAKGEITAEEANEKIKKIEKEINDHAKNGKE